MDYPITMTIKFLPLLALAALWSILPAIAQKEAAKPKGGETHIYKTIGDLKLPLYLYAPEVA